MMAWRLSFQALCMLMLSFSWTSSHVATAEGFLNVKDYGAVADGKTDNSRSFLEAWKKACGWEGKTVLTIPKGGKYYVRQAEFAGPCKGAIKLELKGDLYAPTDKDSLTLEYWIKFSHVDYLTITGGGKLYGGGSSAWPYKGCGKGQACMNVVPQSLRLEFLKHTFIQYITSIDSKDKHISIFACEDMTLHHVRTTAPADSLNTDGVHIAISRKIRIFDSTFDTGDDCLAIFTGSTNVNVRRCWCGPGHGISLGSMGRSQNELPITKIRISNCTISNSDNGFRIKTWAADSFPTYASNIRVEDIIMDNVQNPIIIDQYYCPSGGCDQGESNVQIRNIKLRDIKGTSSTETAIDIQCSRTHPCEGLEVEDIHLLYRNPKDGKVQDSKSLCSNVKGFSRGTQVPKPCV